RTLLKKPIRINGLTGRDGASCSTDLKHEEVACFQGFLAIWRASKHERSVNPIGVREGGASAPISRIWPTPTPARPRQGGGGRNEGAGMRRREEARQEKKQRFLERQKLLALLLQLRPVLARGARHDGRGGGRRMQGQQVADADDAD